MDSRRKQSSLVFNGYLLCTDGAGHVVRALDTCVHAHTHAHWECKTRLYVQELGERAISVECGEASQRKQKVSWALADAESTPICGTGTDLI